MVVSDSAALAAPLSTVHSATLAPDAGDPCVSPLFLSRCGHGFMHHQNDLAIDDWGTAHLDRASLWSFLQYVVTAGEQAGRLELMSNQHTGSTDSI